MEENKKEQENDLQEEIDVNKDKIFSKTSENSDKDLLTIDEYQQLYDNFSKFSYRFITQYQNDELNKFKDEILSFFKTRDKYFLDIISSYRNQIQIAEKKI